ncbi:c-type cytochrome [Luteimonas panaciterrae]|uniref:c-type cytochrome n=1 Tax=Luteimonas panaciterrae TaxID=363885 RepID=UPI001CFA2AD4|nr:cytochrome c [Luteimonas panaciterrae]
MKTITIAALTIGALAVVAAAGGAAVMYSGAYNVAADEPHTRPVYALLDLARERSIATRANELQVPADIGNPARVRQGAGNYAAMCAGCHLSPGAEETELSKGLYPAPPDLSQHAVAPAKAFWAIKHGIKASGMPAWGKSMGDDYIWNMAAFLQQLPKLDKAQYDALVASSGGHSHGGSETGGHSHADKDERHPEHSGNAGPETGHDEMSDMPNQTAPATGETHAHADGKQHMHAPSKPTTPVTKDKATVGDPHVGMKMQETKPAEPAEDQHEHQH